MWVYLMKKKWRNIVKSHHQLRMITVLFVLGTSQFLAGQIVDTGFVVLLLSHPSLLFSFRFSTNKSMLKPLLSLYLKKLVYITLFVTSSDYRTEIWGFIDADAKFRQIIDDLLEAIIPI